MNVLVNDKKVARAKAIIEILGRTPKSPEETQLKETFSRLVKDDKVAEKDEYPFSTGQIRHYLLMRHKNGLNKAVRKIGKRLYLRRDLFEAWLESQASQGGQS